MVVAQIHRSAGRALTAPFSTNFVLRTDAAIAWDRAVKKYGKAVLLTGAWRSQDTQVKIFTERYVRGYHKGKPGFTDDVRKWNGQLWTRRKGTASAAVPGTSNHGGGIAVDVKTARYPGDPAWPTAVIFVGFNDEDRRAFLKVAAEFGWEDAEGRSINEPWHLTYNAKADKWRGEKYPPSQGHLTEQDIRRWERALGIPYHLRTGKITASLLRLQTLALNDANKKGKFLSGKPLKVDGTFDKRDRIAFVKYLNWLNGQRRFLSGKRLSTKKDLKSGRRNIALRKAIRAKQIRRRY